MTLRDGVESGHLYRPTCTRARRKRRPRQNAAGVITLRFKCPIVEPALSWHRRRRKNARMTSATKEEKWILMKVRVRKGLNLDPRFYHSPSPWRTDSLVSSIVALRGWWISQLPGSHQFLEIYRRFHPVYDGTAAATAARRRVHSEETEINYRTTIPITVAAAVRRRNRMGPSTEAGSRRSLRFGCPTWGPAAPTRCSSGTRPWGGRRTANHGRDPGGGPVRARSRQPGDMHAPARDQEGEEGSSGGCGCGTSGRQTRRVGVDDA
jgi:hypothetical protein